MTGAGGFLGGWLAGALLEAGRDVRAVDRKLLPEWWQAHEGAGNLTYDLGDYLLCGLAAEGCDTVFHFAADMGGRGFIDAHPADCMLSVAPTAHMLKASADAGVRTFVYASSACVYRSDAQESAQATPLREDRDAYPADPDGEYGWEKLFSERMTLAFGDRMRTRAARLHGIYGPCGSWGGGREKAPAAMCRKVAQAVISGGKEVEVWGDGQQARTFLYVTDAVDAVMLMADSDYGRPLNVGSDELVTIDQLAELAMDAAGVKLGIRHVPGPQGPRGRSSDNALVSEHLGWKPRVSVAEGMELTYRWVYDQARAAA